MSPNQSAAVCRREHECDRPHRLGNRCASSEMSTSLTGHAMTMWLAPVMLEQAAGLSSRALDAIAELERRVIASDGGRVKLEWGRLRRRKGDRVEDLLWWESDRLLGLLGLYSHGSALELAGMVAPDARRRGIGTALLDAAMPVCHGRDIQKALLIVPRPSVAGKRLALRRRAVLDHSEHALALSGEPMSGPHDPALSLRPATAADLPLVSRLLEAGFGEPAPDDLAGAPGLAVRPDPRRRGEQLGCRNTGHHPRW